ncbi:hypothetical protein BKA83DRAFT_4358308 [Pisolithus microcarpus]|nr:hypothetical protein BKA83DRAFT_4358308 [Pisolithus microcarpus]
MRRKGILPRIRLTHLARVVHTLMSLWMNFRGVSCKWFVVTRGLGLVGGVQRGSGGMRASASVRIWRSLEFGRTECTAEGIDTWTGYISGTSQ